MVKITYVKSQLPNHLARLLKEHPSIIEREQIELTKKVKADLEKTVRTWRNPAKFSVRRVTQGFTISTKSKVWMWVDEGTKPHKIPQPARKIVWRGGTFTAKTTPNLISSKKGGLTYQRFVTTPERKPLDHPGTKARNFTQIIVDKWRPRYQERVRIALNKAHRGY